MWIFIIVCVIFIFKIFKMVRIIQSADVTLRHLLDKKLMPFCDNQEDKHNNYEDLVDISVLNNV